MTPGICLILPALALLLAGTAPYAVQLDARRCQSLPSGQVAGLGPRWAALARYVQRCPVHGPNGRPALSVDIVRLDRAIPEDYFKPPINYDVPNPVLRDTAGVEIGELPEGFPIAPPSMLRVRFTDWRRGFPHEIRLYEAGESALAPHAVPSLRWNPGARRFE